MLPCCLGKDIYWVQFVLNTQCRLSFHNDYITFYSCRLKSALCCCPEGEYSEYHANHAVIQKPVTWPLFDINIAVRVLMYFNNKNCINFEILLVPIWYMYREQRNLTAMKIKCLSELTATKVLPKSHLNFEMVLFIRLKSMYSVGLKHLPLSTNFHVCSLHNYHLSYLRSFLCVVTCIHCIYH